MPEAYSNPTAESYSIPTTEDGEYNDEGLEHMLEASPGYYEPNWQVNEPVASPKPITKNNDHIDEFDPEYDFKAEPSPAYPNGKHMPDPDYDNVQDSVEGAEGAHSDNVTSTPGFPKFLDGLNAQQTTGELYLAITFSWSYNEMDLDTQVRLASAIDGVQGCVQDVDEFVVYSRDSTVSDVSELFFVRIEHARWKSVWVDMVDIDLSAYWTLHEEYKQGSANVQVDLVDQTDSIVQSMSREFNPYMPNAIDKFLCLKKKIGRVQVVDVNGVVSMKLETYCFV